MNAENRLGIIGTIKQEGRYLWQRMTRGYSDKQVERWRATLAGDITSDQVVAFRIRAFTSGFTSNPLVLGGYDLLRRDYSPQAMADFAVHVFSMPEAEVKDEMALEAWDKLSKFNLLGRQRFSIAQ